MATLWKCDALEIQDKVLVGHQPFLGECVQYWLTGRAHPGIHLAKSSVVSLTANGFGREEMELKFMLSNRVSKLLAFRPGKQSE